MVEKEKDIVERLRETKIRGTHLIFLRQEAADEIERLRACEYRCLDICPYCSKKLGKYSDS
jgi:hypothetical protein